MDHILQKFTKILCGTLDNQDQIDAEIENGKQIHPYAKHVTDRCEGKIINRPEGHEGIYILEESYYIKPGETAIEIKPLLFYVRSDGKSKALLQSVQIPEYLDKARVTNNNPNLQFNWDDLSFRPFGTAEYTLHNDDYFTVNHLADMGNGVHFQLIETLREDGLEVMELVHINGTKVTNYDTPILYKRVNA